MKARDRRSRRADDAGIRDRRTSRSSSSRHLSSLVELWLLWRAAARSRSARLFERLVGMKLKSGWGITETCSSGQICSSEEVSRPDKPGLDRTDARR